MLATRAHTRCGKAVRGNGVIVVARWACRENLEHARVGGRGRECTEMGVLGRDCVWRNT